MVGVVTMSGVLVLNTDNTALHTVSLQHAVGMLVREVAIVESARDGERFGPYPLPDVLRLVRYVKTGFLYSRAPGWTKRGVLRRDRHLCAYCGGHAATVDHIQPLSKGGQNTWANTVACCVACNARKADKSVDQVGMRLRITPYAPTRGQVRAVCGQRAASARSA